MTSSLCQGQTQLFVLACQAECSPANKTKVSMIIRFSSIVMRQAGSTDHRLRLRLPRVTRTTVRVLQVTLSPSVT